MQALYSRVIEYLKGVGEELVNLQGRIADIGVTKANLTEKDIEIERTLAGIIQKECPSHSIFAEEEHPSFTRTEDVWVIDPISATRAFIDGRAHFASVVSHIHKGKTVFAVVYDPSVCELFSAQLGEGAFLNGEPIQVSDANDNVLLNIASSRYYGAESVAVRAVLKDFATERNQVSFAVNYCWVAAGRNDGVVSLAKDAFPEFAGELILKEAGGRLTNIGGGAVQPDDRIFVGGNPTVYKELIGRVQVALKKVS